MLSGAKHLAADRERPFAALRSTALNEVNGVTLNYDEGVAT